MVLFLIALPSAVTAGFVSSSIYPSDAIASDQHGSAVVFLHIAANGTPTKCTVLRSTTVASLDKASCEMIMAGGHFNPARDSTGNPVPDTARLTIYWLLLSSDQTAADLPINDADIFVVHDRDTSLSKNLGELSAARSPLTRLNDPMKGLKYPIEARRFEIEGETSAALLVDPLGKPQKCAVIRSSSSNALDQKFCDHLLKNMSYSPAINANSIPVPAFDVITVHWKLRD